jgi:hypothetical protein
MSLVAHLDALSSLYLSAGDQHRAGSFYRAARAVEAHPTTAPERLRGIGPSTLAEIAEYRQRGTSKRLLTLTAAAAPSALEELAKLEAVHTAFADPAKPVEPVHPPVEPVTDSHLSIVRPTGLAFGLLRWTEETLDYKNIRVVDHVVGYNIPALEAFEIEDYIDRLTSLGYSAAVEIDVMVDAKPAVVPSTPWVAALHAIPERFTVERVLRVLDYQPVSVAHLPRPVAGMHKLEDAMKAQGVALEFTADHPPSRQLLEWAASAGLRYYVGSGCSSKVDLLAFDQGAFLGRILAYLDPMLRLYR